MQQGLRLSYIFCYFDHFKLDWVEIDIQLWHKFTAKFSSDLEKFDTESLNPFVELVWINGSKRKAAREPAGTNWILITSHTLLWLSLQQIKWVVQINSSWFKQKKQAFILFSEKKKCFITYFFPPRERECGRRCTDGRGKKSSERIQQGKIRK